jgi:mono/diheme cytochrome c family protein
MRNTLVFLLTLALQLLPALAALGSGKAEFARLNNEVEGLKARLGEGVTRADFGAACADCHGATPKYPLLGARLGYDTSGHKNNDNSSYANGGDARNAIPTKGSSTS